MNPHPALVVRQLSVSYDKVPVLWDINLSVPTGQIVGVIGPNGAGKSTLLKSILNMIDPLSGTVEILGMPFKKVRNQIAYVPQRSSVDWDFPITVLEVVLMGLYAKKGMFSWCSSKDKKAAYEALDKVGMTSYADRQISQLSGGQQQRVFIARALLQDAQIYFMDEPFAGVDVSTEQAIVQLMRQLKCDGKTLFIVHHDLNTVQSYFDWVVMLKTSLIASGPTVDVFTEQALFDAYGRESVVLDETLKLSLKRASGLK
jgi:manganese/zinc/iron transport system ATP- binding protein